MNGCYVREFDNFIGTFIFLFHLLLVSQCMQFIMLMGMSMNSAARME